jgi:hypothetical protein
LHYAFAALTSDKALLAEARGDLPAAIRLANEAIAIDEASIQRGGPCAAYLPVLLVRRSVVEIELHQTPQAASDAYKHLHFSRSRSMRGRFPVMSAVRTLRKAAYCSRQFFRSGR